MPAIHKSHPLAWVVSMFSRGWKANSLPQHVHHLLMKIQIIWTLVVNFSFQALVSEENLTKEILVS